MSDFLTKLTKEAEGQAMENSIVGIGIIKSINSNKATVEIAYGNKDVPTHYSPGEIIKDVMIHNEDGLVNVDFKIGDSVLLGYLDRDQHSIIIITGSKIGTNATNVSVNSSNEQVANIGSFNSGVAIPSDLSISQFQNGILKWPVGSNKGDKGYISASYPTYPSGGKHDGIDIASVVGTPILSACDGKVITSTDLKNANREYVSYGRYIVIEALVNNKTIKVYYCHMSERLVEVGTVVKAGDQIGKMGSTGNSSGSHLHFEIREDNVAVNPLPYLMSEAKIKTSSDNINLQVPIIRASQWGRITTEPLSRLDLKKINAIALHHMANATADITQIQQMHLDQGWIAIGYNFWIGFDGKIYEGRGFNLGAGVENQNENIISIGFQGDYHSKYIKMSNAQFNSGIDLIKNLKSEILSINRIGGHKDYMSTACPGQYFPLEEMETLRKRT